jgi:formate hydrogenlyase subunit 3/multisubunit Na+/H+ antiporter MnhD subunit
MNQAIILFLFPAAAGFLIPLTNLNKKRVTAASSNEVTTSGDHFKPGFTLPMLITLLAYAAGAVYGAILLPKVFAQSVSVIIGNWLPPFGINLFFTPLTVGIAILIYCIAGFVVLFDIRHTEKRKPNYYLLYALMVFSSIGMVLTGDLFNLFVFLEIGGIASFACVGTGNRYLGAKGGVKYLIQAQLLSLLMLAGIILVYSAEGALNIAFLSAAPELNPVFGFLVGILILLPILLETKLFPFHSWVPETYRGASASFGGSLSGIMALAGGVVLLRLSATMMNPGGAFGLAQEKLSIVLIVLGGITVLVGELAALGEKELKKVLGFSSVGQMGMITVGIGAANLLSLQGAIFLLVSHTAAKVLLFLVTGFFIRTLRTGEWSGMRGIARRFPLAGGLFVVGAMTLMGIPLFSGFWGKISLLKGVLEAGGIALFGFVAVLLGTIIEGVYFMRIGHGFFTAPGAGAAEAGEAAEAAAERGRPRYTASFLVPALVLAAAVVVIGIFPKLITPWITAGSEELSNPDSYIERVLPERVLPEGGAL